MLLNSDAEIVAHLRKVLRPTIEYYRFTLQNPVTSEDPRDYLYDEIVDYLMEVQSRGDFQSLIEALL